MLILLNLDQDENSNTGLTAGPVGANDREEEGSSDSSGLPPGINGIPGASEEEESTIHQTRAKRNRKKQALAPPGETDAVTETTEKDAT